MSTPPEHGVYSNHIVAYRMAEDAGSVLRRTILPAARGTVVGGLALGVVASIANHLALGAAVWRIILRQTQQFVNLCCDLHC